MPAAPASQPSDPAAKERAERVAAFRRRVKRATLAAVVLPGAGHWFNGQRLLAALIFGAQLASSAAIAWHLAAGLTVFESPLGSFLFGALLRATIAIWAFDVIHGYYTALEPDDRAGLRRRRAFALNLLLPGSGYLLIRAWLRAATGLLVLGAIVYFAGLRYHRFVDLVLVGAQLIMGAAVYQHLRITEAEHADPTRLPQPPLDPVPLAQVASLFAATAALIGCAFIVQARMPDYDFTRVDPERIMIRPSPAGIAVRVPDLGVSLTAAGDGWIADKPRGGGLLLSARHERNVALRVGTELVLPFVREERYVEHLRRRMIDAGFTHKKSKRLSINGRVAYQLWFSRSLGHGQHVDQWTVAIPHEHFALLMLIQCNRARCKETLTTLERTRDSVKIEPRRAPRQRRRGSRGDSPVS